jgi:putative nucleotidyltransferase with HDIG domain
MVQRLDLTSLVRRVNELAPLPAVAMRVLQLVNDDSASADELASAVSVDQALTATLLRVANSAYIAAGREITTVRDAAVLLGVDEVRKIVLTASMMRRFGAAAGPLDPATFWGHSVAVAIVADVMARHTGLAKPDEAYTAGILHDIGKLVMNQYAPDQLTAAISRSVSHGVPIERAEIDVFGFSHSELGSRLAAVWRLPDNLVDAIAAHHGAPPQSDGLSYVVAQSYTLCRDHGLWCGFDAVEPGVLPDGAQGEDPLRVAVLARMGGMEQIIERTVSFLQSSSIAPPQRIQPQFSPLVGAHERRVQAGAFRPFRRTW